MKQDIQAIIEDVLAAAPELKGKEATVRRVVEKLLAARPGAEIGAAFMAQLRDRLTAEIAASAKARSPHASGQLFSLSRLGLAGGAFLGLAVVMTLAVTSRRPAAPAADTQTPQVAVGQVRKVEAEAFGSLAAASADGTLALARDASATKGEAAGNSAAAPAPAGLGGGGYAQGSTPTVIGMPAPPDYQQTRHEYRYDGELPIPLDSVEVLMAERDTAAAASLGRLASVNLGLIDLGRFSSPQMQAFTVAEERDYGYAVSVSPSEGTAYISKNWQRWPQTDGSPTVAEMPDDNEIIAVAQVFFQDYGLDLSGYGNPQVDRAWKIDALRARAAGGEYWTPSYVTVRYPLLVRGLAVYNESGQAQGISVTVDVRLKKVTDAGPISLHNYLASAYAAADDMTAVRAAIAAGGLNRWQPEGARVLTHELAAPARAYLAVWKYRDGIGEQILVPALAFENKDYESQAAAGEWTQERVVVPLAKDLYTAQGQPVPMPYLLKGDPANTATSSADAPAVDLPLPATPPAR